MTDLEARGLLSEREVVALTIWGEARNQEIEGKVFVGSVIRNRVLSGRWGRTYAAVCFARLQFSCWSPQGGTSNYDALLRLTRQLVGDYHERPELTPTLRELLFLAEGIIGGQLQDRAQGSNHYITRDLWKTKPPAWAVGQLPQCIVGDHVGFLL